jgi:hypothetical protein
LIVATAIAWLAEAPINHETRHVLAAIKKLLSIIAPGGGYSNCSHGGADERNASGQHE